MVGRRGLSRDSVLLWIYGNCQLEITAIERKVGSTARNSEMNSRDAVALNLDHASDILWIAMPSIKNSDTLLHEYRQI